MWTAEDFPGADSVPWPLLIRARHAYEIDAVVASTILRQVSQLASVAVTERLAEAAHTALADSPREEAGHDQRLNALTTMADFDELCPPWFRWPRPKPRYDDISDPLLGLVVEGAMELVRSVGSESLNKTLGAVLQDIAH